MAEPMEAQQPESGAQSPAPEAWFFCLRFLGGRYAFVQTKDGYSLVKQ